MFITCIQPILIVKQLYESAKVGIKLILDIKTPFIVLTLHWWNTTWNYSFYYCTYSCQRIQCNSMVRRLKLLR